MAQEQTGHFPDSVPFSVGISDQNGYEGKGYVSIGAMNPTTFIIPPEIATVEMVRAVGSDKAAWRLLAIAVLGD